jgi:hypothetical protein
MLKKKLKLNKALSLELFQLADLILKLLCLPHAVIQRSIQPHLQLSLALCL